VVSDTLGQDILDVVKEEGNTERVMEDSTIGITQNLVAHAYRRTGILYERNGFLME
jgi:hypothetical protein